MRPGDRSAMSRTGRIDIPAPSCPGLPGSISIPDGGSAGITSFDVIPRNLVFVAHIVGDVAGITCGITGPAAFFEAVKKSVIWPFILGVISLYNLAGFESTRSVKPGLKT